MKVYATTVHRVGNRSTTDQQGRLLKFRVQTLCGRPLGVGRTLTDLAPRVTCRHCIKVMAVWKPRASQGGSRQWP